jgi:hypothetical protein
MSLRRVQRCHYLDIQIDMMYFRDIGFSDSIHRLGFKKQTKKEHDVSETGSVSVLR